MGKISLFILLLFYGCVNRRGKEDFYNIRYYIKSERYRSLRDGFEVYVFSSDTSRKMLKYFYPNGNIQLVCFFHNSKRDGRWLEYFENGNISAESFFTDGLKDSVNKTYYLNGRIATVEQYDKGVERGTWKYYNTTGMLDHVKNFK